MHAAKGEMKSECSPQVGNYRRVPEEALALLKAESTSLSVIEQHQEELATCKNRLLSISDELIKLDLDDAHMLVVLHGKLKKLHFKCSCEIRELTKQQASPKSPTTSHQNMAKLPQLGIEVLNNSSLIKC